MSSIKIGGRVIGLNGKPITNARIKIIDKDIGSKNDVIFRGRTDNDGKFRGESSNWQDKNWINGPFNTKIDTPDIPDFVFEVTKADKKHTGSFLYSWVIDYTSAPIICPWNNPDTLFAKVNDVFCYTPEATRDEISKNIENKKKIVLHIFDPDVRRAFAPLTLDVNNLRNYIKDVLGPVVPMTLGVDDAVATGGVVPMAVGVDDAVVIGASALLILLGISAVIIAAGAVYGVVVMGEAMSLAINKGCQNVSFENSTEVDNNGDNKTTTIGEFDCSNT